jgi:site-specific recombinase XerC
MQLELTDEVKQEQIVTSFVFDSETDNLSVRLNGKCGNKKITSPIESTWSKTIETFVTQLRRKKINQKHIIMLSDVADNAADRILKYRINRQVNKEKEASDQNDHVHIVLILFQAWKRNTNVI